MGGGGGKVFQSLEAFGFRCSVSFWMSGSRCFSLKALGFSGLGFPGVGFEAQGVGLGFTLWI